MGRSRQIDEAEARKRPAAAMLVVVDAVLLALLPFVGVRPFTITLLTEALIFAIWSRGLRCGLLRARGHL